MRTGLISINYLNIFLTASFLTFFAAWKAIIPRSVIPNTESPNQRPKERV